MLITARKNLGDALEPSIRNKRIIKRCICHRGLWIVYSVQRNV